VYGTKAASMLFWGLHGLPVVRFFLVDALGAVLGATVFGGIGYLVSGSATLLLGKVRRVQLWLLGALVVGVVLVFLINWEAKKELHIDETEDGTDAT
jgi:membrane protein DedA with SNARE-associated domain